MPGGKLSRWSIKGYVFDTGATLLTMPQVLRRLYKDLDTTLEDHLNLEPLDPQAEYVYADGFRLRIPAGLETWAEEIQVNAPADSTLAPPGVKCSS